MAEKKPRAPKKQAAPKAETKAKTETAEKKTGTHEVIQEFRDYAESTDGTGYKVYKVGEDVSHLPESKLRTFVDANLVKQIG